MKCKDCRFFDPSGLGSDDGQCRRFPPQVIVLPYPHAQFETKTRWPDVRSNHWCGEFKPRYEVK